MAQMPRQEGRSEGRWVTTDRLRLLALPPYGRMEKARIRESSSVGNPMPFHKKRSCACQRIAAGHGSTGLAAMRLACGLCSRPCAARNSCACTTRPASRDSSPTRSGVTPYALTETPSRKFTDLGRSPSPTWKPTSRNPPGASTRENSAKSCGRSGGGVWMVEYQARTPPAVASQRSRAVIEPTSKCECGCAWLVAPLVE